MTTGVIGVRAIRTGMRMGITSWEWEGFGMQKSNPANLCS